jgi:DNA polymerase-3 subunit delta'
MPPWLEPCREGLERAFAGSRPPHALLLYGAEGTGVELLATWVAARVLCQAHAGRPCGACKSCGAVERGVHPDLSLVTPLEESKQIRIDEVRELTADLALKSHQGGYKVAILNPAEALNANAANALLKTLEEPASRTLLILVTHRRARLPATIVSRCHRLVVATPSRDVAQAWLAGVLPGRDVEAALKFARGAPLRALDLAQRDFEHIDHEMQDAVARLGRAALDVPATAEQWTRATKGGFADRATWLETWITDDIARAMAAANSGRNGAPVGLPAARETLKIRGLYRVLDRLRQLRIWSASSLNMTMAVEGLLLDLQHALTAEAGQRTGVGRR